MEIQATHDRLTIRTSNQDPQIRDIAVWLCLTFFIPNTGRGRLSGPTFPRAAETPAKVGAGPSRDWVGGRDIAIRLLTVNFSVTLDVPFDRGKPSTTVRGVLNSDRSPVKAKVKRSIVSDE
ncbi:hypothetical protein RU639_013321 [Aspergillus parasiticus]